MTTLFDADGISLRLSRKLGEGGEGAVFEVADRAELVAKLYHGSVEAAKAGKLLAMTQGATASLLQVAAWPVSTLHSTRGGRLSGVLMPRIADFREAHTLYSPKQRQSQFPEADWGFLVWAARNCAAAMKAVHDAGHVIGDVNQKNFMIAKNATVRLIDCDSFQITSNGRKFFCLVGVPEFTPPELHGKPFDRVERTPNHDAFGLAVLVFHLLFMGRHPFAGRFSGIGDMPPERAIRELRFAYSQTAASKQIIPPPHSLPLSSASYGVASLFERAFSPTGLHGGRPTCNEWVHALEGLSKELVSCAQDAAHKHHRSLSVCPWCAVERGGGPIFFLSVTPTISTRAGSYFDFQAVIRGISAVAAPAVSPQQAPPHHVPAVTAAPLPETFGRRRVGVKVFFALAVSLILLVLAEVVLPVGLVGAIALFIVAGKLNKNPELDLEKSKRKSNLSNAERQSVAVMSAWQRDVMAALGAFRSKRAELEKLANEYQSLPALLQKEKDLLNRRREELQKKAFLEAYFVRNASLQGIGQGLKSMLASYGFETAADINARVLDVPGIGTARYTTLRAWKSQLESRFRFDPTKSVNPSEAAAIDHRFALRRKEIERLLLQGKQELEHLRRRGDALSATYASRFAAAAAQSAQARADMTLIP